MLNFDGYNIPNHTKQIIASYIEKGHDPGDFIYNVMSNNLMRAFGSADSQNTSALKDIVMWVYNCAPQNCHGNEAIVLRWMENHRRAKSDLKPVV